MSEFAFKPGEPVLFLGAGVSLPPPAGAPLFAEVRAACADMVGIDVSGWGEQPRGQLLDHTIPEVFLATLTRAGLDLAPALASAVRGKGTSQPNPVHRAVADHLAAGGSVWTTNWDTYIEDAYREQTSSTLPVIVTGRDAPPHDPAGILVKLHGTADDPDTLMFRPNLVVPPLPSAWDSAMVAAMAGRPLVIAGYAGADVDLYPALSRGLAAASIAYWLEMGRVWPDQKALAELWRFDLDRKLDWDMPVPRNGRFLLWCGAASARRSASDGLLSLLAADPVTDHPPPWDTRHARVSRALNELSPTSLMTPGARALAQASLADRLGLPRVAIVGYARAVIRGDHVDARKAARMLAYRALRRLSQSPIAARVLSLAPWSNAQRTVRRGSTSWTPASPAEVEEWLCKPNPSLDGLNDRAAATRWMGSLDAAARLAGHAQTLGLAYDLDDRAHDWLERIARSTFELANSALWQGRHRRVEDHCRTGYMQLTGGKWAAWDYTIRAAVRAIAGDADGARRLVALAETLIDLHQWDDAQASLHITKAQCARLRGDLPLALDSARLAQHWCSDYPQMQSMVAMETAEVALAAGDSSSGIRRLKQLCESPIPIIRGLAALRLSEASAPHEAKGWAVQAREPLQTSECLWALRRLDAIEGLARPSVELAREGLIPSMCAPGGPWLF